MNKKCKEIWNQETETGERDKYLGGVTWERQDRRTGLLLNDNEATAWPGTQALTRKE